MSSAHSLGDGEIVAESKSGLAWKVELETGDTVWIPKSVIHDNSEVWDDDENSYGDVVVQRWWAEKNDLA